MHTAATDLDGIGTDLPRRVESAHTRFESLNRQSIAGIQHVFAAAGGEAADASDTPKRRPTGAAPQAA